VTVRIRPMVAGDAPSVAELATQLGYPARPDDIVARLARLAKAGDGVALLVAVGADDRVVAWAHVELRDTLVAPPAAQLMALVVADDARNRGFGRQLVEAVESWALDRGCVTLLVATRVTRTAAHRFYRRAGYTLNKTSHIFEKALPPSHAR
jgi:GNAT superfamily N-acetyltransferase